ncbi:flagellar biosynthetic protein FliR [Bdellovibrio bacteriovorus]|uniref:Flagellar biosynthetic protein FliR n=1 Tax=Bdellovibrio bacteriovorus TaxID=959 RepID=A0A150WTN6_BDEBC|nr:flagellar biosynthetic protein FliR [Bdellovibrio bacteriovorus]KYG67569.1 flagellar biosynthetic protein FliR [Bdellovibrio bacteriovorus]
MINWSTMTEAQILLFALVFLRMIAFVISSAVFGSPTITVPIKVLLSIVLSVLLFPLVKVGNVDYALVSNEIIGLAIRELIVGLSIGFLTRLFFFVVTMTGDLVSMSVGLSASQMYNPMLGSNGNVIDQFYSTLGTLVFLAINGHHMLISAIAQSYDLIPVSSLSLNVGPFAEMAAYGQDVMIMAIKMCAPVMVTILLVNVAMGILGRAVPQINVLVTSMPVTIMIGMAVVFLCLPLMTMEMQSVVDITASKLFAVMKHL